jgi:hypothetical protein
MSFCSQPQNGILNLSANLVNKFQMIFSFTIITSVLLNYGRQSFPLTCPQANFQIDRVVDNFNTIYNIQCTDLKTE